MRFDDVCLILELYVEINVIFVECMYKYFLVNNAHRYEHKSNVAVTKSRV